MIKTIFTNRIVALFIVALLLFAPFTNKAYHMDSAVTVYGAKQMTISFLNPPLGEYGKLLSKWNHTGITKDSFFHSTPHPPLVSFYLVSVIKLFGDEELIINWFMFPFYFFSVLFFFLLINLFFEKDSFWLTIIFAISPAVFVNSQNVMVDTPLMSMVLASFYFLFRSKSKIDALWAGVFAGFACLIKFTAGTLFISAFTYYLIKKDLKKCRLFLIPFIFLNGFWFIHNFIFFGKSQLIANEHAHYILGDLRYRLERMLAYIGGAWIFPIIPVALFLLKRNKVKIILITLCVLFPFFLFLILKKSYTIAESSFYVISVLSTVTLLLTFFKNKTISKEIKYALIVHLLLQVLGGLFLTLYAVRYTLPFAFISIIAFQMIINNGNETLKRAAYIVVIISSFLISLGLSISDYQISNANRFFAKEIKKIKEKNKSVYFQGRLGYLYYMDKEGFTYFEQSKHPLKDGDLILKNTYFSGDGELIKVANGSLEQISVFSYPLFNLVTKGGVSGFYGYDRLPYWFVSPQYAKREYVLYKYLDTNNLITE